MRRLAPALLLVIQLAAGPAAASPQLDPVATLILDLQTSLQSGGIAEFAVRAAPRMPRDQLAWLTDISGDGDVTTVTVRERARTTDYVIAEVFVARGNRGFVANWRLGVGASTSGNEAVELVSVSELSAFRDLIRLALDPSRQFEATDLIVAGPDFSLTLPTGTVFVADVDDGTTALVLQGRSQVRFTPADRTEQGQLRIFSGAPDLVVNAEDVFVRLNPNEVARTISWRGLRPVTVVASQLSRARAVFDARVGLSYHFDLADLAGEHWSVPPTPGSMLVDLRTRRFGWLTYARTPSDPEDVSLFDRARRRQISLYRTAGRRGPDEDDDPRTSYRVQHTALDLRFEPDRTWMSGLASLRLVMQSPASSLTLRLASTLVVTSVSSPELGPLVSLRFSEHDSFVVGLPASLEPGRAFTLDVQYHGRVVPQVPTHEVLQAGLDMPPLPLDVDFPFSIQPRFLYSNRGAWYPQPSVQDHATAEIRLTVPAAYSAIASGEPLSNVVSLSVSSPGQGDPIYVRTVEYRASRPVRYLACLVARLEPRGTLSIPVASAENVNGASQPPPPARTNVEISIVASPRQAGPVRATTDRVASMVAFYSGLMGEAPYPSFSVVSLEDMVPGGHSPAYFAIINQPHPATPYTWARDPVAFEDVPDFFLAHEVAHQWWGQAVGWRNYHEQWISEGFAQYLAWMYISSIESEETSARVMRQMQESASRLSGEGPIHLGYRLGHLRGNPRIFRGIVYNKSAVVLHMLRRLIGDEAFIRGLRRLYTSSRFAKADVGTVERAFQAETPLQVGRFFTRWILGEETPKLRLSWSRDVAGAVVVTAHQIGPLFDVPYDITVLYENGTRERTTLRITQAAAEFPIETTTPVRRVEFEDELTIADLVP